MTAHEPELGFVSRLRLPHPGRRVSQTEILDELRWVILEGDAPAGTLIPADEVSTFFKVSLIPVRESLKTLMGEGLVTHQTRHGYLVAGLNGDELHEAYLVREALEAVALRAAVLNATAEDDGFVHSAYDQLCRSQAAGQHRAYQRDSRQFHLSLMQPSRMHLLAHMFEMAWNLTESAQPLAGLEDATQQVLHDEHAQIMNAFLARDVGRLLDLSHAHYRLLDVSVRRLVRPPARRWASAGAPG